MRRDVSELWNTISSSFIENGMTNSLEIEIKVKLFQITHYCDVHALIGSVRADSEK